MIQKFIMKGVVQLTKKEFDETPTMMTQELPNTDQYDPIFQFKFMDMTGSWIFVDVIHVKQGDELEKGVNFLCSRIEIGG